MQEQGYPLLNIICEKVAVEGITRFEDRYRLPVGISVNMTSFSAKLLTQVLHLLAVACAVLRHPPDSMQGSANAVSLSCDTQASHAALAACRRLMRMHEKRI